MDFLKLDPGLAIWTWICFGILFFLLSKFVFPQFLRNITAREAAINKSLDDGILVQQRLVEIEAERAGLIASTRTQADEILRQTRLEAADLRTGLLKTAEEEARAIVLLAQQKAEDERSAMMAGLKLELAAFVCESSEKVIGKSFLSEADRAWTEELVKTL